MLGSTRSRILTPLLITCLINCYDVHICTVPIYLQLFVGRLIFYLRTDRMSGRALSCGKRELLSLRGRLGSPPVLEEFMLPNVLVFCVVFFGLFVFVLCVECPMLPVSLDCPFLIGISVFSNAYFSAH